jgi:DNA-directed DNA polymerase III PolC
MYLNCRTYFSYRYGTISSEELVNLAVENGLQALALTNINNTADLWDFYSYAQAAGIKPILGLQTSNEHLNKETPQPLGPVLLARDALGMQAINEYLSFHLQANIAFPQRPNEWLMAQSLYGAHVYIVYPLALYFALQKEGAFGTDACINTQLATNEIIGIGMHEINKLYGVPVQKYPLKFVALHTVSFQNKMYYNVHRLLRAVHYNSLLSKLTPTHYAPPHQTMVRPTDVLQAFANYPQIITNTLHVIDACNVDMPMHTDKNKKTFSATKEDDRILLEKLALDGVQQRYGSGNKTVTERVKKELRIIHELGFNAYFLITWDIIRYAQSRGFYYVGRGSGANSIIAYCLQITDVDPIELDLYFERFLNPHRASPPDFDMDFSWKDRDEVIDYVFKRYGKNHVALLGMHSTFQYNAIVRELGKVFGLPKAEIDALCDHVFYYGSSRSEAFKSNTQTDQYKRWILQYGKLIVNFPNHASIHPGGMLISELPIYQYTAVGMPPKGFATAQLDMFVAENVGLYKLDILSQRGLGHIKEAVRLIRQNKQQHVDIHDVEKFKTDKNVAAQIRSANTIGCFYIESPAMRMLLKKLRCDTYITLVAASSIIRPGVAKSGMMREFIQRYQQPDKVKYLHPKMKELLQETYGVMVYQEDVIKVAHHYAGIDMADADILRRAMSGKYRGKKEMDRIEATFFANCKARSYPEAISKEVWRQIESFSGYSFSKAHSASFAVESYQSLYLKTYYPMEFMVAVINNFGGFYSTELYFHELKKTGAQVVAPCINNSEFLTTIYGTTVYVGFIHIQGIAEDIMHAIIANRKQHGSFASLHNFIERTHIGTEHLNVLIRINAFNFTHKNKRELLWEANFLQKRKVHTKALAGTQLLFEQAPVNYNLPQLATRPYDDAIDQIELLGFSLGNIFDMASAPNMHTMHHAEHLVALHKSNPNIFSGIVYLVTGKPVRTSKGDMMYFGTFIDPKGQWVDTVHFADSLKQFPMQGKGFYHIKGRVTEEFGMYSVEVFWMEKIGVSDGIIG